MKKTLNALLCRRLTALIERSGRSVSGLSKEMGRTRTYLPRALSGVHNLKVATVDEVLDFIGEPVDSLWTPVLWPGDQAFLDWIDGCEHEGVYAGASDAEDTFANMPQRLARLVPEGLVTAYRMPDGDVVFNGANALGAVKLEISELLGDQ